MGFPPGYPIPCQRQSRNKSTSPYFSRIFSCRSDRSNCSRMQSQLKRLWFPQICTKSYFRASLSLIFLFVSYDRATTFRLAIISELHALFPSSMASSCFLAYLSDHLICSPHLKESVCGCVILKSEWPFSLVFRILSTAFFRSAHRFSC